MDSPILSAQNDSKLCRICLDNDNQKDIISPCLCTGGSAYVHRKCLDNWRSLNNKERAFESCEVCQFKYIIEPVVDDPSADKKRLLIFRLLVTRDITLIILLFQAIIIGMTFALQAADKKNNDIKNFYPDSMDSFGVYYLSSLILFFALLGLFGIIASCCGMVNNNDMSGCTCYTCFWISPNCHGNHNCDGQGAGVILIVFLLILAVLGVFVGIMISVVLIKKVMKRHTNKLWLRQETKKYIVRDFQGRRNELENLSSQHRNTNLPRNKNIHSNKTQITPSAPVEVLSVIT
jgi:hypothetical protein